MAALRLARLVRRLTALEAALPGEPTPHVHPLRVYLLGPGAPPEGWEAWQATQAACDGCEHPERPRCVTWPPEALEDV